MTATSFPSLTNALAAPLRLFDGADRPIGVVGFDVPIDVLLASGRAFGHLPWRKGRATPLADRWLESSFPGWARSILEDWLRGEFDCFDTVVFSRGDDAAQRLYYYLCELQRRGIAKGPRLEIFDIAKIPRAASVKHCEQAIRHLLATLGVDAASLPTGIIAANAQRTYYQQLDTLRKAPGHMYENIARASLLSPCLPIVQSLALPTAAKARRVLLSGSVPPDDMLHRAVEKAGWNVVGEVHQLALTRLGAPIVCSEANAVSALALHCNKADGSRDFSNRAAALVQRAARQHAAAVVLWLTDEDEVMAWHVARQRAALAAARIPTLVLTRRRWDGADGAADQIRQFLQELAA